ncbi:MAG: hypothetical protein ABFD10_12530 [Prolixibacteraceae bacterium]
MPTVYFTNMIILFARQNMSSIAVNALVSLKGKITGWIGSHGSIRLPARAK